MKQIPIILFLFVIGINPLHSQSFFFKDSCKYSTCKFAADAIYFSYNGSLVKTDYSGNLQWVKNAFQLKTIHKNNLYGYSGNAILKMDTASNPIWAKNLSNQMYAGTYARNWFGDIMIDGDNKVFIAVNQPDYFSGSYENYYSLLTLDSAGNYITLWTDTNPNALHLPGYRIGNGTGSLKKGAWISVNTSTGIFHQAAVMHTDPNGLIDTTMKYLEYYYADNNAIDIIPLADSNYLVIDNATGCQSGLCNTPFVVSKINEAGNLVWNKVFHSTVNQPALGPTIRAVTADSLNNYYFLGSIPDLFDDGYFVMKLDKDGNIVYLKTWSTLPDIVFTDEIQFKNGNIYCSANFKLSGNWMKAGVIIFDTLFNNTCYGPDTSISFRIYDTKIYAGQYYRFAPVPYTVSDTAIQSFTNGTSETEDLCVPTAIKEKRSESSISIYPNPTDDNITICLDKSKLVTIEIIDLTGRIIYTAEFNGIQKRLCIPSAKGIYFLRVINGSEVWTHTIIKD
jgi:hypothetical protein